MAINKYKVILVAGLIVLALLANSKEKSEPKSAKTGFDASAGQTSDADPAVAGQIMFIPKIGVWAPVNYARTTSPLDVQTSLLSGIVHTAGSAIPGHLGNAYFLGLAENYPGIISSYNEVFAGLDKLSIGDIITVIDYSGQTQFRVFATYLSSAQDAGNIADAGNRRLITLQQAYPIGSSDKRFTVVAELEQ